MSSILINGFSQNFPTRRYEIFPIWRRGNNIFFLVKRENNGKTILIWAAPRIEVKSVNFLEIFGRQFVKTDTCRRFTGKYPRNYGNCILEWWNDGEDALVALKITGQKIQENRFRFICLKATFVFVPFQMVDVAQRKVKRKNAPPSRRSFRLSRGVPSYCGSD